MPNDAAREVSGGGNHGLAREHRLKGLSESLALGCGWRGADRSSGFEWSQAASGALVWPGTKSNVRC
jgi:hypothetical protein